jgi:hypothetical protein
MNGEPGCAQQSKKVIGCQRPTELPNQKSWLGEQDLGWFRFSVLLEPQTGTESTKRAHFVGPIDFAYLAYPTCCRGRSENKRESELLFSCSREISDQLEGSCDTMAGGLDWQEGRKAGRQSTTSIHSYCPGRHQHVKRQKFSHPFASFFCRVRPKACPEGMSKDSETQRGWKSLVSCAAHREVSS